MTTVACYNFNNALEGATVYDDTGAHNGSVVGTVPLVTGPISQKGRSFVGNASNYISIPHHADFKIDQNLSVEAWVRLGNVSTYNSVLSKGNFTSTPAMDLMFYSTTHVYIYVSSNASNYIFAYAPYTTVLNNLYYLAATWDRTAKKLLLYINGVFVLAGAETGTYTGGDTSLNVELGKRAYTGYFYPLTGSIYAVRWSNVVKTAKEIFDTYMAANVQET